MELCKWFRNSSLNFSSNPVTRLGCSLTVHLILQFSFYMFKMGVDIYSSSVFRHHIHCGHLFLQWNAEVKQFINFSLSVGHRKTSKIFVWASNICNEYVFFFSFDLRRETDFNTISECFRVMLRLQKRQLWGSLVKPCVDASHTSQDFTWSFSLGFFCVFPCPV